MYAVLCSPQYWNNIQKSIIELNEEILYKSVDVALDFNNELNKISRLSIQYLIIDTLAVDDHDRFIKALVQFKIMNESTRIIAISEGSQPGDKLLCDLVTKVHIYDIIVPSNEDEVIETLHHCVFHPSGYKKGIKWMTTNDNETSEDNNEKKSIKVSEDKIIIKKQLVGKVVIGLTGTHSRVGTTHLSIALANYLRRKGYSVAYLNLNQSNAVETFLNSYEDMEAKEDYYSLRDIHYYSSKESFNINIPYKRNYDFFILDCGVYDANNPFIHEYERANVKGVVTTAREWEISFLETFLMTTDSDQYDYLFNFADVKLFDYVLNQLNAAETKYKAYRCNMESDLINGKELDVLFEEWLSDFIITSEKKGKPNFLKKFIKRGG